MNNLLVGNNVNASFEVEACNFADVASRLICLRVA